MKVRYFPSAAAFRAWLLSHHATATELWVGFYKKSSGRGGLTYSEAVDEALCVGWIDGIIRRVDEHRFTHRFSPRQARSPWSAANIARFKVLRAAGRTAETGVAVYQAHQASKSGKGAVAPYSYENRPARFSSSLSQTFKADRAAWTFFASQPPGYRRTCTFWVMSAKRDETRHRRLRALMADSRAERRMAFMGGAG
jgi:uncharacterized protein YdeI (YjbR/CyaY-like superfamily)